MILLCRWGEDRFGVHPSGEGSWSSCWCWSGQEKEPGSGRQVRILVRSSRGLMSRPVSAPSSGCFYLKYRLTRERGAVGWLTGGVHCVATYRQCERVWEWHMYAG